jgi:hypothetical protein
MRQFPNSSAPDMYIPSLSLMKHFALGYCLFTIADYSSSFVLGIWHLQLPTTASIIIAYS